MAATVSGGTGQAGTNLSYSPAILASVQTAALSAIVDSPYKTALYYDPSTWKIAGGTQGTAITSAPDATAAGSSGTENLHLSQGSATIAASPYSSVIVEGAGSGTKLTFVAADLSGSAGGKLIVGANDAVTVIGGAGDNTLIAGDGADRLVAGHGNDTLIGGLGRTVFDLTTHAPVGSEGVGSTIQILDFSSTDVLALGSTSAEEYALSTFHVVGGNGMFLLDDGTKVVLHGFTTLNGDNFKG